MKIETIRIYAEVLEQGLDFKSYIEESGFQCNVQNIYTKKGRANFSENDSLIDRIRKVKDVDILISAISDNNEYPLLMIEYSTAVPTDDHKMQRSDIYFWSAVFKVPVMKISPSTKGMNQNFGGGSRFNDDIERIVAYNNGAVLYPIEWKSCPDTDVLETKENKLSCIYHSNEISKIIKNLLSVLNSSLNYEKYFDSIRNDYAKKYCKELAIDEIKQIQNVIVNSSRFNKNNGKICVKINRFGHAMDPDRGILYFVNMLVGTKNVITEIQVNRSAEYTAKGGYKSLFDLISRENLLKNYVENIIKNKNNTFSENDAIYIFLQALNIDSYLEFKQISEKEYLIEDDVLYKFLTECPSMVSKSIFYLSTELKLTDINRETICSIKWNLEPVKDYLNTIRTKNYTPINIKPLENQDAKEDIITFASIELYKKIKCSILAVSYPGAQGDRCILIGQGRKILRTYIDIITYKHSDKGITVFLEECKDIMNKCASDADKLCKICTNSDYKIGMNNLFKKIINRSNIKQIYKSIGAKYCQNLPSYNVDYVFMFNIRNFLNKTIIDYTVGIINMELIPEFIELAQDKKRLAGTIEIDKIYIIS